MLSRPGPVRALIAIAVGLAVVGTVSPAAAVPPRWIQDIDDAIGRHDVSVAIAIDGRWLYRHGARTLRAPASNEKLLLSMALLHRASVSTRIKTEVFASRAPRSGVLRGNLWLVGHGDPEDDRVRVGALARAVRDAGIRRIRGGVMGATTGFRRDWWAPGWRDYFPADYIPIPTALTFEGNEDAHGVHVADPERRAARSLTNRLRAIGVKVAKEAGAGPRPAGRLRLLATVRSDPLEVLLRRMNRRSRNFYAEVLGKWLGGRVLGAPGSIAKTGLAIERFGQHHGAAIVAHDGSGLSYRNRVRPEDVVELLWWAERQTWLPVLRFSLPTGNHGTLKGRLRGVRVRAKTGTLEEISALSGWVWIDHAGTWGEFSIMSRGMDKSDAVAIEDRVVRIVSNRAS
jgi:serine-type D-Ala-D-Ala carboxypeptidase/endopeptidase (penicillin-binding protein 4)